MYAVCIEASHERGMGHLFRALVLAAALEQRGAHVHFLVNDAPEVAKILREKGHRFDIVAMADIESGWEANAVQRLGIHVWINDRQDTDVRHAKHVLSSGARLVTFDDYGTGAALADLHIAALPVGVPAGKRVLSGLRHLVLDPEIARYRRLRQTQRNLLVTLGGSDTHGLTVQVVKTICESGIETTIVIGPAFRHEAELVPLLSSGFTIKRNVPVLAAEIAQHDFGITAGGITLFEACAAGLPCIAIAAEPWERHAIALLAALGACVDAGYRSEFDHSALLQPLPIETMSEAGIKAVDLDGADRVAEAVFSL